MVATGGGGNGTAGPASSSIAEEEGERAGGGVLACRASIISCVATRSSTWEMVGPRGEATSCGVKFASRVNLESSGTVDRDRDREARWKD